MALQLLKILLNHEIFTKYSDFVGHLYKETKELGILYRFLCNLHEKYERDIAEVEFSLYVLVNCQEKDKENLQEILDGLRELNTNGEVLDEILSTVVQRHQAYELAVLGLEVAEGRKEFNDLVTATQELTKQDVVSTITDDTFVTDDIEMLLNDLQTKPGLRWRLKTLNRMMGSLRKGDFGFLFARPETGKTTFLASEVTHFAGQANSPILWINNEEGGNKVKIRLYQAMLGVTLMELHTNAANIKQQYLERGGDKIRLYDSASVHRRQVEQLCRELEPSLIIFDQLDKVKGFTDDREDLRLGSIYIWARELAKQYCPIIAVSQADASGEGKRWLTMDNVANAKTAKQAEADWILGIGKTHSEAEEYMRHLSLCKNKLTGDPDTEPELRHGRLSVNINPEIARYEDMP
jgi:KaiC/GvpD/RAD55 family RecA-like ATPase